MKQGLIEGKPLKIPKIKKIVKSRSTRKNYTDTLSSRLVEQIAKVAEREAI